MAGNDLHTNEDIKSNPSTVCKTFEPNTYLLLLSSKSSVTEYKYQCYLWERILEIQTQHFWDWRPPAGQSS